MTIGAGADARSSAALAALTISATLAVAVLTSLGVWQLERRTWKLDLIDRVERRIHASPVAAPGRDHWAATNAKDDEYRRVTVSGHFLNGSETLVQAVTELGPGSWVLTPLVTGDGSTILVNRGFVSPANRDPATRRAGEIEGKTTVTGLLRMTEPKGGFLRSNDPDANLWYSRDVGAIAGARGLKEVAPYFIDADATPNPGGLPVGGLTVVAFRNAHLVYALTWFTLALLLAVVSIRFVLEDHRLRRGGRGTT